MQVKDGSWYQRRDKKIVQASFVDGNEAACGHVHRNGETECSMSYKHNGRAFDTMPDEHESDLIREVSNPTKPLQLRVGGKYLRKDGSEHEIDGCRNGSQFPFYTRTNSYKLNGQCAACPCDCDLICEILDQPEPELVLEAGREYECDNGDKAIAVGIDPFNRTRNVMIVAFAKRSPWCYELDGVPTFRDSYPRIIRPWIAPPTEFVDPRTGKRYAVGPEIKEVTA